MADIGKYYVQIVPSAEGISGSIQKAIAPEATAAGKSGGKAIAQSLGSTMTSLGGNMMKAGAVATAVSVPIIAGIKKAMSAYEVQNAAETKLTEIYKTRMGATEDAAQATMKLASALQQEGVIGDEVTLSGAQQLATFAKMPDTVNSLLPALDNLLAQQKGVNASAEDATGIANLFGKALMGQTGALTRVGITFDETQEKILKTGTEEERAAVLAEVVTQNVGHMNKTLAETPSGKIQQMKNAYGDLWEVLGGALAPTLQQIAEFISARVLPGIQSVLNVMQGNPVIGSIIIGIAGVLAIGGPLLILLGSIVSSIGALTTAAGAVTIPFSGVAIAIGAVIAVLALAYAKSETFRTAVNTLVQALGTALSPVIKSVTGFIKLLVAEVMSTATAIGNALAPVIQFLTPILTTLANIISKKLQVGFKVLGAVVKTVGAAIRGVAAIVQGVFTAIISVVSRSSGPIKKVATDIKNALKFTGLQGAVKTVFNGIKNVMEDPVESAKNAIKGMIDKIKGFFHFSVSAPHIPVPHFSISPAGWKVGDLIKGKIPSLSVRWYAKGGIMEEPTLFGGGEKGAEAIVPLDPFWKKLDQMSTGNTFNITMNVDGSQDPEQWADKFAHRLQVKMRTV